MAVNNNIKSSGNRRNNASVVPHVPVGKKRKIRSGSSVFSFLNIFFIFILLFFAGAGLFAYKGYTEYKAVSSFAVPAMEEPYELKAGATVGSVVKDLAGHRFNRYILEIWSRINAYKYPVIQKGPYLVDGKKTVDELLHDMRFGNIVRIKLPTVALIEGMNVSSIEKRLLAAKDLIQDPQLSAIFRNPEYFIRKTLVSNAADETLLEAIGGAHNSLEGLLMPATYDYQPLKQSTTSLVSRALIKTAEFMRERYLERDRSIDDVVKGPYEVLILASLVERESSLEEERSLIAGVFINRLRKGIRLQTDPAVMYGVSPDFKGPLRASQLKRDTPYNTYTRDGLPPTPIAMPSEGAIDAVLNPDKSPYMYFVAKGPDPADGHYFSATLREHNKAVSAYRRAVKEYKQEQERLEKDAAAALNTANAAK